MANPLPKRFRRPTSSLLLFVLVYLALTGLHAMIDGRAEAPSIYLVVGFLIAFVIAALVRGAMEEETS
jgi:protein-S-isoprenylcysteine O-methyltransferase Ste14